MTAENIVFGRLGENAAANAALQRGLAILDRNYRTPYGEIDLVLRSQEGMVIFAEVKTRSGKSFGYPEEAVDARKLEHLIRSANYYVDNRFTESVPWQIDIIAIIFNASKQRIIDFKWFENVTEDS